MSTQKQELTMTTKKTKTALVTGASGYLATELILQLLARGNYRVVATVRTAAKAEAWRALYPEYFAPVPAPPSSSATSPATEDREHGQQDKIRFVIVPDMQQPGAYDEAMACYHGGVDVVFHTASPFGFTFGDNERDMLRPAREGALSVLRSAAAAGRGTVKRVVFTSSFAAVTSPHLDPRPGYTYMEADWNPVEYPEAVASADKHFVYLASKTFAEQEVWEFARTQKPEFSITSIVPPIILGRARQPFSSMTDINQSSRVLHRLLDAAEMPRTPAYVSVDVRDCARCHMLAAESAVAAGKRYLTIGSAFSMGDGARIIARLYPELASRLPPFASQGGKDEDIKVAEGQHYGYSSSLVGKDLGIEWTPLETTIGTAMRQLLDVERKGEAGL